MLGLNAPIREAAAGWWRHLTFFWRAQVLGWGLFVVVDLANRQFTYRSFPVALALTLIICPILIALSAGLGWVYSRHVRDARLTLRSLTIIFAMSTIAAASAVTAISFVRRWTGWSIPEWGPVEEVAVPLIHYTIVLAGWSIGYFWVRTVSEKQAQSRRALAAEADALRAEIQHLRLQLDPHFLFNALNGVAEEIPENPEAALAMMRDLTDYLRHSLAGINNPVVPVEAEVASLAAYLRIQEARFGQRLRTHLHVDAAATARPIANFLLQPLVENAVKHGERAHGLDIDIDIAMQAGALKVEISNTGTLEGTTGRRRGRGIGVQNVRRRLALHYPDRHTFTLREIAGSSERPREGRVVATLVLEGEPCSGEFTPEAFH